MSHPGRVAFLLSAAGYRVSRGLREALAPLDLEPRHFAVLNHVAFASGASQQALASALQIPPSRMVAILDELEDRGVVERRPHPTDRRARALYLTEAGRALLGRARRCAAANEDAILEPLTKREREQLGQLLALVSGHDLRAGVHPALADDEGATPAGTR